ncbi:copper resistance D family protein [Actinokineospora iranica]|uniref:Copper transport protein n=1 Tax=Actinokineospora iranica TaxID=1271860 RepID=A0A1G6XE49_9PSEU|nr:CopD family protein [Actinokineospora iranica]SDD75637.1 copper transport protein [Actinokineospora iranica]
MVEALYGVARWVAFLGFALVVGSAFFTVACWPAGAAHRVVRALLWGGWGVLLAATLASLALYGPYVLAAPLGDALSPALLSETAATPQGTALLTRVLLLCLAAGFVKVLLARAAPLGQIGRRRAALGVLAGAAALAATWSAVTHSAARSDGALALPLDMAHLVAMGVWLGGVVVLVGVVLAVRDPEVMRAALPPFSKAALISVAVLAVTGLYTGWRQVETLPALVSTGYGELLLLKVSLVAAIVGIAVAARSWVGKHLRAPVAAGDRKRPRGPGRSETGRFRAWVAAEAGIGLVVLAVTSVLVNFEPAHVAYARAQAERAFAEQAGLVKPASANAPVAEAPVSVQLPFDGAIGATGQGVVSVVVTPAKVGANTFHIGVFTLQGTPRSVTGMLGEMSLSGGTAPPVPLTIAYGGPGHYIAENVTLPTAGQWQLKLILRVAKDNAAGVTSVITVR